MAVAGVVNFGDLSLGTLEVSGSATGGDGGEGSGQSFFGFDGDDEFISNEEDGLFFSGLDDDEFIISRDDPDLRQGNGLGQEVNRVTVFGGPGDDQFFVRDGIGSHALFGGGGHDILNLDDLTSSGDSVIINLGSDSPQDLPNRLELEIGGIKEVFGSRGKTC